MLHGRAHPLVDLAPYPRRHHCTYSRRIAPPPKAGRHCGFLTTPSVCCISPRPCTVGSALLAALDHKRRLRIARYAEEIAATLARDGGALQRLQTVPADRATVIEAIRELGRISGYIETLVDVLEHHLDGRKLAGVKRRLEQLRPAELRRSVVSGRKLVNIERLASAEGYFRALADGLKT